MIFTGLLCEKKTTINYNTVQITIKSIENSYALLNENFEFELIDSMWIQWMLNDLHLMDDFLLTSHSLSPMQKMAHTPAQNTRTRRERERKKPEIGSSILQVRSEGAPEIQ